MAIEEAGTDPVRLARAIHRQLGVLPGAIPIHEIARALDITHIRAEPLTNFEGALVTMAERDTGAILVNANASRRRQRFTVAHELGHFLSLSHQPTHQSGFWCNKADLSQRPLPGLNRHRRQEGEANTFAIELAAPDYHFTHVRSGTPDLQHVVEIAALLHLSREATARRYVELHSQPAAVLFFEAKRLRYSDWNSDFPQLALQKGDPQPDLPVYFGRAPITSIISGDPADWLTRSNGVELGVQLLHQQNEFEMVLIHIGRPENDDDSSELGRFPKRFHQR
jgi:predicted Zn-dependent protease